MKRFYILDTTLRDGEQMPGVSLNVQEKLEIASQLIHLNVDVIEAGFPVISDGDFEAVKAVAQLADKQVVCALARAVKKDIDQAWQAVKYAANPRIHVFMATSEVHMRDKLHKTPEQVAVQIKEAVAYALTLCDEVEFSAEDSTRTDFGFLCEVVKEAVKAGAAIINLPDTVGFSLPDGYGAMFANILKAVPQLKDVTLSAHCHNDLGLAVANSLAALSNGAAQIECTVGGMGERTGNAALEEIAVITSLKKDLGFAHDLNMKQIYRTSKLVSHFFGIHVPVNRPVVGKNAFQHSAGIHQHGVMENPETYEIMKPEEVGIQRADIVLGKHSGRHAFEEYITQMGYHITPGELNTAFEKFKVLADRKKEVSQRDLEAILNEDTVYIPQFYDLVYFQVSSGNTVVATATVQLKNDEGELIQEASCGDGPIDAVFHAIERAVNMEVQLQDFHLKAVSGGKDALGEVTVTVLYGERIYLGRGISTDIIHASAKAYVNAINRLLNEQK